MNMEFNQLSCNSRWNRRTFCSLDSWCFEGAWLSPVRDDSTRDSDRSEVWATRIRLNPCMFYEIIGSGSPQSLSEYEACQEVCHQHAVALNPPHPHRSTEWEHKSELMYGDADYLLGIQGRLIFKSPHNRDLIGSLQALTNLLYHHPWNERTLWYWYIRYIIL